MREAFLNERETRFELATPTLARLCSTTELFSLFHSSASAVKWTANLRNGCAWAKHSLENFFWFQFLGEICNVNYLAHLVLGGADSDVRLGNFIGDSVKGNRLTDYPHPVAQGIRFHRWVDCFADQHPAALHARAALRPRLGRLASVGVDLLYDHFLAKHFDRCCPDLLGLGLYAQEVMADLALRKNEMPLRSQRFFTAMQDHNWLVGYGRQKEMEAVCRSMDNRIALRLGVPANLKELFAAAEDFGVPVLEDEFFLFWEEFRRKASMELRRQKSASAAQGMAAEK